MPAIHYAMPVLSQSLPDTFICLSQPGRLLGRRHGLAGLRAVLVDTRTCYPLGMQIALNHKEVN